MRLRLSSDTGLAINKCYKSCFLRYEGLLSWIIEWVFFGQCWFVISIINLGYLLTYGKVWTKSIQGQCIYWPNPKMHQNNRISGSGGGSDDGGCSSIKIYTMRLWQNGQHIAYNIFKLIFCVKNQCILIKFSLRFSPKVPINNKLSLVDILAPGQTGDRPLSELVHWCIYASLHLNAYDNDIHNLCTT